MIIMLISFIEILLKMCINNELNVVLFLKSSKRLVTKQYLPINKTHLIGQVNFNFDKSTEFL